MLNSLRISLLFFALRERVFVVRLPFYIDSHARLYSSGIDTPPSQLCASISAAAFSIFVFDWETVHNIK